MVIIPHTLCSSLHEKHTVFTQHLDMVITPHTLCSSLHETHSLHSAPRHGHHTPHLMLQFARNTHSLHSAPRHGHHTPHLMLQFARNTHSLHSAPRHGHHTPHLMLQSAHNSLQSAPRHCHHNTHSMLFCTIYTQSLVSTYTLSSQHTQYALLHNIYTVSSKNLASGITTHTWCSCWHMQWPDLFYWTDSVTDLILSLTQFCHWATKFFHWPDSVTNLICNWPDSDPYPILSLTWFCHWPGSVINLILSLTQFCHQPDSFAFLRFPALLLKSSVLLRFHLLPQQCPPALQLCLPLVKVLLALVLKGCCKSEQHVHTLIFNMSWPKNAANPTNSQCTSVCETSNQPPANKPTPTFSQSLCHPLNDQTRLVRWSKTAWGTTKCLPALVLVAFQTIRLVIPCAWHRLIYWLEGSWLPIPRTASANQNVTNGILREKSKEWLPCLAQTLKCNNKVTCMLVLGF